MRLSRGPARRKAQGVVVGQAPLPAKRARGPGKAHDGWGGAGSRSAPAYWDKGVPQTQHVFKALGPDSLAAALLGERGVEKDKIQRETGAKLVLSNRGDCYPQTSYRVLGVYADDNASIVRALEAIMQRVRDLGDEERKAPPAQGLEFLGKEPGEYVFRLLLTKHMSSHIIGTGGSIISRIRQDTGAKVFIENDTHLGHRMTRVIGQSTQIVECLRRLNEYVQAECEDPSFATYAGLVNFGDKDELHAEALLQEVGLGRGSEPAPGPGAVGARPRSAAGSGVVVPAPTPSRRQPQLRPKSAGGHLASAGAADAARSDNGTSDAGATVRKSGEAGVRRLLEELEQFPAGAYEVDFSVDVLMPAPEVDALLTAGDDAEKGTPGYLEEVQAATNTEVIVGEQEDNSLGDGVVRRLTITGTLPNMYLAHAMLMRRCQELQRSWEADSGESEGEEELAEPEELEAQIAKLEEQLRRARARRGG